MRFAAHATLVLLLAAAGCGGSSTAPSSNNNSSGNNPPPQNTTPSNSSSITVDNDYFDPASTTVPVNTKVTWSWNACGSDGYGGQTCTTHSVEFDDGQSSAMQSEGSWSRTFTVPGTYKYHCAVHGASMSGAVTVQ